MRVKLYRKFRKRFYWHWDGSLWNLYDNKKNEEKFFYKGNDRVINFMMDQMGIRGFKSLDDRLYQKFCIKGKMLLKEKYRIHFK